MQDYKMRMLKSPQSRKVMQAVFNVAMDPEHKHFPACSKMIMDRIAPIGSFAEGKENGIQGITVNITGVPGVNIGTNDTVDGEFTEVDNS